MLPPLSFIKRYCLVNPAAAHTHTHTRTHTRTHTHMHTRTHTHRCAHQCTRTHTNHTHIHQHTHTPLCGVKAEHVMNNTQTFLLLLLLLLLPTPPLASVLRTSQHAGKFFLHGNCDCVCEVCMPAQMTSLLVCGSLCVCVCVRVCVCVCVCVHAFV